MLEIKIYDVVDVFIAIKKNTFAKPLKSLIITDIPKLSPPRNAPQKPPHSTHFLYINVSLSLSLTTSYQTETHETLTLHIFNTKKKLFFAAPVHMMIIHDKKFIKIYINYTFNIH